MDAGHESAMLVKGKGSFLDSVVEVPVDPWRYRLAGLKRRLRLGGRPQRTAYRFNHDEELPLDWTPCLAHLGCSFDALCLHWIGSFLSTRQISRLHAALQCPVLWVVSDLEPMTGGCHYAFGCEKFMSQCRECPQVTTGGRDTVAATWQRKRQLLGGLPITFVCGTSWVRRHVGASALFSGKPRVDIGLPVNADVFRPVNRSAAREVLGIPSDRPVLLCGADELDDRRKGMPLLRDALNLLGAGSTEAGEWDDLFLLVMGHAGESFLGSVPFEGRALGYLRDEISVALVYQSADVFVCPSVEDAGPMMIPEAAMCGTPIVAFEMGGAPDLVETTQTGVLVRDFTAAALARGVGEALSAPDKECMGREIHRRSHARHAPHLVAERYINTLARIREEDGNARSNGEVAV